MDAGVDKGRDEGGREGRKEGLEEQWDGGREETLCATQGVSSREQMAIGYCTYRMDFPLLCLWCRRQRWLKSSWRIQVLSPSTTNPLSLLPFLSLEGQHSRLRSIAIKLITQGLDYHGWGGGQTVEMIFCRCRDNLMKKRVIYCRLGLIDMQ